MTFPTRNRTRILSILILGIGAVGFSVIDYILQVYFPIISIGAVTMALMMGLVLVYEYLRTDIAANYDKSQKDREATLKQTQSMMSVFAFTELNRPLPMMGAWAALPDFINLIMDSIIVSKPKVVVDCGSGVSSLMTASHLKKIGEGKVYSLEQDEFYYHKMKAMIQEYDLGDYLEVIHAPLKEYDVGTEKYLWYSINDLPSDVAIDMIIVDGPPHFIGSGVVSSRYPAIPLLHGQLSKEAIVWVDDYNREKDQEHVARWVQQYSDLHAETLDTERGTCRISRKS